VEHVTRRLPAHQDAATTVYLGDAREVLAELPAASVDCCVTSPPYWGIRDFGVPANVWDGDPSCRHRWAKAGDPTRRPSRRTASTFGGTASRARRAGARDGGSFCKMCGAWRGALGLEPTPELFVAHLVDVFRQVRRVLKPWAVLWLNIGDTYYHATQGTRPHPVHGLKAKDLVGVPWRVALALQQDGWFLRADLVWRKASAMPEPVRDRPVRAHEMLFLLAPSDRYFYDAEALRELHEASPSLDFRRSVWTIGREIASEAHTATFPSRLVEACILAGTSAAGCCPACGRPWERVVEVTYSTLCGQKFSRSRSDRDPRARATFREHLKRTVVTTGWRPTCDCGQPAAPAVVLDPFVGAGTTVSVADRLGRHSVAIDLHPAFTALIRENRNRLRRTVQEAA
jgi:DNA modification methylase